jgi:hypothetical protein
MNGFTCRTVVHFLLVMGNEYMSIRKELPDESRIDGKRLKETCKLLCGRLVVIYSEGCLLNSCWG